MCYSSIFFILVFAILYQHVSANQYSNWLEDESKKDCLAAWLVGYCKEITVQLKCPTICRREMEKQYDESNAEGCIDSKRNCQNWAKHGYCGGKYTKTMFKDCPISCGFCSESNKGCKDNSHWCQSWKKYGYCGRKGYEESMATKCPYSCGKCPDTGSDKGCTNVFTTTQCQSFRRLGDCTGENRQYMKRNCKKTCGECDSSQRALNSKWCRNLNYKRIVGGEEAKANSIPWQVYITPTADFFNHGLLCGGSLVTNRWIITAAHCFKGSNNKAGALRIVLGLHNWKNIKGKDLLVVDRLIKHPQYRDGGNHDYDIALIRLKKKIKFTHKIKPVCVVEQTQNPVVGEMCMISGWGKSGKYKRAKSPKLFKANIAIVSDKTCQKGLGKDLTLTKRMLCAGHPDGKHDSCQGDSGGPLTCKHNGYQFLYGIVSHGEGCGKKDKYGIYTKVNRFRQWIEKYIPVE